MLDSKSNKGDSSLSTKGPRLDKRTRQNASSNPLSVFFSATLLLVLTGRQAKPFNSSTSVPVTDMLLVPRFPPFHRSHSAPPGPLFTSSVSSFEGSVSRSSGRSAGNVIDLAMWSLSFSGRKTNWCYQPCPAPNRSAVCVEDSPFLKGVRRSWGSDSFCQLGGNINCYRHLAFSLPGFGGGEVEG